MAEIVKSIDELLQDCDSEFSESIKLHNELKQSYNPGKDKPEKYFIDLRIATSKENNENTKANKSLLTEFQIKLKPSQWSVLLIDNEILQKTLLRAKDLGFLEAYQQNAAFLKQDVDKVIKRMSELDAYGIPYKNEKGRYQSFLFSARAYAYVLSQNPDVKSLSNSENNSTPSVEYEKIKEYADRIMETFSLTGEAQIIYARLAELMEKGLGIKEILMEVFKNYGDNLEYLSSNIDEILDNDKEEKMGRVA